MKTTKKVKSTGRFGSHYGVGIRKRVLKVEERQNKAATCPFCKFKRIRRKAAGLFECKKCGAEFTGGAYESETLIGKTIKKMVTQKSFASSAAELVKEEKTSYSDIEDEVSKSMDEEVSEVEVVKEEKPKKKKATKKVKKVKEKKEVKEEDEVVEKE